MFDLTTSQITNIFHSFIYFPLKFILKMILQLLFTSTAFVQNEITNQVSYLNLIFNFQLLSQRIAYILRFPELIQSVQVTITLI